MLPVTDCFENPVPPYPGWERRIYRLPRTVTAADIRAFVGEEELYIRDTGACTRAVIPKYGLIEINLVAGAREAEIWFAPGRGAYPSEYLDALFATRF